MRISFEESGDVILLFHWLSACDDTCTGALLNDIEQMFDWLNHIDINELLKAPWYNLLRLNDSLRRTKNAMDDYRYQIEAAEGILRESLFSINLESRIQSINYQLQTIFNQKIPRVRVDLHEIEAHNKKQRIEIEDEYKLIQRENFRHFHTVIDGSHSEVEEIGYIVSEQ